MKVTLWIASISSLLPASVATGSFDNLDHKYLDGYRLRRRTEDVGKQHSNFARANGSNNSSTEATTTTNTTSSHYRFKRQRTRITKETKVLQPRIVGGRDAGEGEYPFYVQLDRGCGATLIHENVLLTAAHCAFFDDTNWDTWSSGAWIGPSKSRDGGLFRRINGISLHPNYNNGALVDDFALLTLNLPATGANILPVQLNRNASYPSSQYDILTAIGMGRMDAGGGRWANILQEVDLPFVPHDACQDIWEGAIDEPTMICAGGETNKDSCMGDSGGPLLDRYNRQIGITSFGVECGTPGWPAVYSRVSTAIPWIDDFICMNALSMPSTCGVRFPVQIRIKYDDYPEDISWRVILRDADGSTRPFLIVPPDTYINGGGIHSRLIHLPPGRYTFQMDDSHGDGLCCLSGEGSYRISLMDSLNLRRSVRGIRRNGMFEDSDIVNFEITEKGDFLLDQNQIRIDITYDNFPNETSWTIIDQENNDLIHASRRGTITSSGLVSVPLELSNGDYWLFVLDSAGNGICCSNGRGSIDLYNIVNGHDVKIASMTAEFESLATFAFTLP